MDPHLLHLPRIPNRRSLVSEISNRNNINDQYGAGKPELQPRLYLFLDGNELEIRV